MRTLLSNLIMPLPIFWMLVILSALFVLRHKKKTARFIFALALFWLLVVSTPFLPNLLVTRLENRYETFQPAGNPLAHICNVCLFCKPPLTHILVLGGGHTNDSRLPANNRLSVTALARLAEGIRLHRQLPGSILITSGWSGKREPVPQAEVLAQAARLLGVDSTRIKTQILPANTWMEATEYKRLYTDSAQLVLVTSAAHMPRAMYLFQKAGLNPIPAPTNHLVKKGETRSPWFWLPSSSNIKRMESAVHEYAGLLWYKMGGE